MTTASLFPFALAGQPFPLARSPLQDRARHRHGRGAGTPSKPQLLPPAEPTFLPLGPPKTPVTARTRTCPAAPHAGGPTARPRVSQRREVGREEKKTGCGERGGGNDTAERGPATTARAAETGPSRKGVLTRDRETARASDRSGHARQNRRESHCTTPLSSPTTPAAPSRPETRRPPGSPRRRHRHERDRCRHTDAYRRRPPSGSGSPRPTSRRTRPTAVLPQNGPVPESEINQRQTRTLSTPRRGRRTPAISPAVGTLPREGGARRHNHTAREAHSTHHARRRPASRERPKSWTRARGRTRRKARVRHGKTGGDPGAHRRLPTPRPARRPSGGEESTAHAGVCTEPFPQPPPHNRSHMAPQQRQDDRQALPRVIPPRTRSGEARAAVDERANAARAGGGQGASPRGDHSGETPRDRKKPAPFPEDS